MSGIKRYFVWIEDMLTKQVNATGLALFRIAYSCVLLCEIGQIIYFRHLIYDKIPYVSPSEINVLPGLIVWAIAVVCIALGFFTRRAALVNYILSLVFIGTIETYEYHVFYTYMGMNFLLMFLDVSQNHSLDRLRVKLKYSNTSFQFEPLHTVGVFHYFLPIAVGVGFVYFDSIFFKLASYNWLHGLGMWLPASLPMAIHTDVSPFLNIKWLALGLGYLTLVFELVFLFTFFLKKFRIPLLIIGIGLHLGIIIIFPIPWFGLTVLSVYLLMVPHGFWKRIGKKLISKNHQLTVFYDTDCPLCTRTQLILSHFDYRQKIQWMGIGGAQQLSIPKDEMYASMHSMDQKGHVYKGVDTYIQIFKRIVVLYPLFIMLRLPGIYQASKWIYGKVAGNRITHCTDESCSYSPLPLPMEDRQVRIFSTLSLQQFKSFIWGSLFMLLILLQVNVTFHAKLISDVLSKWKLDDSPVVSTINSYSKKIWGVSKIFLGITRHGVFMDGHFDGYNHILALEAEFEDGTKIWLPIIRPDGTAGWYDYSFNWVKWTFRVMDNEVDQKKLSVGIRDFTTFWAIKNGYLLHQVRFNVYVRPLEIPKAWEKDFLKKQKMKEWRYVGQAYWFEEDFVCNYPQIEKIEFDE